MKSMIFVLALSITLLMSALVAGDDASDSTSAKLSGDPVIADMIEEMDEGRIYTTTEMVQRIPTRVYGTAGNEEAARYLYSEISGIPGLSVEYTDGNFKNIIGILPGVDDSSEEIFMVGAHYDSKSSDPENAPGATDNAIGVAVVLEMARIMSQYQFNHTITFAFWNDEEYNQGGSRAYAESAAKNSTKIPLYYNLDSSGYDPKNESVLDIMYDSPTSWAKDMITKANSAYNINFTLVYNVHTCTSDHLSFRLSGYPAIMTHSSEHGSAHTPDDTIDDVAVNYGLRNGKLAMAVIAQLAEVQAGEGKISVSKTANPAFGLPSSNVTFTMNVTNSGEAPLSHVFVNDLMPDGMTYISSSPAGVSQGQNVSWSDIGPLASGSIKRLEIIAQIDSQISGSRNLTNHVKVSGKPESGLNVTANASADVRVSEARISVSKTAEPAFGSTGSNVTFTMNVTNSGEAPLSHVFVNDLLPDGMSYVSSSPIGISQGQNVFWSDIGPMASGSSKGLEIVAHIDGLISGSKNLTNHVEVSGKPENGQNVTANASADVRASEARISVSKIADPSIGSNGTVVTFALNLTNNGAALLNHVFVSDQLPAGMTYHSSSQGGINNGRYLNWTDIGPMEAGTNKSLWIKAKIDGTAFGALTNQVDVRGSPEHGEDIAASATATVEAQSAYINVTKVAWQTDGLPGSTINYTMVITNMGSADICQVSAADVLPGGLQYEWDDHEGLLTEPNKVVWDNLGCLKSGEKIQIQMAASITGTVLGDLENKFMAEVIPAGSQEMVTSEAYAIVAATPLPFNVTKTSDKSVYLPEEEMNYTITICNPLEYIPIEDVVVNDAFQNPGIRIVSSYPETGQEGQWHFSEIPPKSCVTITVVAVYPRSNISSDEVASFSITNLVNVTAKVGQESLSGSDTAIATIDVVPVNQAPDAVDDSYSTNEDTTITVDAPGVLGNDVDSDGGNLTVMANTNPSQGTVTVKADGSLTYTPKDGYSGPDSFNYTISDGQGGFDTAKVTIDVVPANQAPDAVDDSATTPEDTLVDILVIDNDSDPENDPLTVDSISEPAHGTATNNGDGTVTYEPDLNYCDPENPDSFSYTISDVNNGTDTATVYVTVTCVKEPPDDSNVCTDDKNCDDSNVCTDDSCDPATGCVNTANTASCDDGSECTADTCDPATGCVYTPIVCDDDSECTADTCDPATGCVYTPITCDDGSECTADTCDPATGCVYTPIVCDDDSECTADTCDPATGCVYTPITCDDGSECTADTCDPATGCVYTPVDCDDDDEFTTDSCDPATGTCVNTPILCDDGDPCTIDTCDPATGCVYTPITCDDGDACTEDSCDPVTGCVYTSLSCDFESPPQGFSIPTDNCPATVPTNDEILSFAGLMYTCDDDPVISVPPHAVNNENGVITWEYTALCGSEECGTDVVGQFDNAECQELCSCEPKAPNLYGCKGYPFPGALFEKLSGGCKPLPGCDQTPVYEIDDSQVDYNTPGKVYPYTVICEGCPEPNNVKTGLIYIRNPLCGPNGNCICPSHCP